MERMKFGASSELNWTFLAFVRLGNIYGQSKKNANLVCAVTSVFIAQFVILTFGLNAAEQVYKVCAQVHNF